MGFQKTASLMLLSAAIGGAAATVFWVNYYDAAPDEPFVSVNPQGEAIPAPPERSSDTVMPGMQTPVLDDREAVSDLVIPVSGVGAGQLTDSFLDSRGGGAREHKGIDITAQSGTAVLAAATGTVEKLFESDKGGTTIYIRSPGRTRIYYYAHLSGYAPGLAEGQQVSPGDVVGYVGSSGNADPSAPHLHFEIIETTPRQSWHEGRSVNPYPILKKAGSAR